MPNLEQVPSAPDLPALESEILRYWGQSHAFEKLRELRRGGPLFRFIDGPITANNSMGVHHAWGRTLKDVFLRYKALTGHSALYQNGFDCQGLWVEVEVERALGFNGKPDIERFGIENFSRKCRERVETYSKVILDQSVRLGQWMDWDHSYYTHDDNNILGIWFFLKQCAARGWLYQKGLPMPWCFRCGTSLSEHEMSGSHQDMEHLSVYVMAPLKSAPSRRLLAWTTTPWTLSANVAAAVNPALTYVEVGSAKWEFTLILCEDALAKIREFRPVVVRKMRGEELLGLEYEPFLPELEPQLAIPHRIVPWNAVDATEGVGVVHIAPACGREDYELGQVLGLPSISPVDGNGRFLPEFGWLAGTHVLEAPEEIAHALEANGRLLKSEKYLHSYPVCWRCKTELIFRLVDEWFIRCAEIRPLMIEAARTVVWSPDFIGKAMEDWLTNMGDWCISRKRYWGLPLPFYVCEACNQLTVIGSREELRERALNPSAVDALPELHRPWIDEVAIRCSHCSAEVSRVLEVGDCWLDAGIVPYSTLGYFNDRERWLRSFPAEWISEMREQVRLWFYSMLFMSVTITGRAPYEKVLAHESVVSEEGARFSKTGFMIPFNEAVDHAGADAMRYLFCSRPAAANMRFGYRLVEMASRKIADLWNIYAFLVNYAAIDCPDISQAAPSDSLQTTDRWLLARTVPMLEETRRAYEHYDTPNVIRAVESYLDEVSNWYVRVSRRRFWRSGYVGDKQACYSVLYSALKMVTIALSPIIPFVTERIWQNAVRGLEPSAPESVHHTDWPTLPAPWRDEALLKRTETVREVIRLGLKLRSQASVRVRQPLKTIYVVGGAAHAAAIEGQVPIVQSELNVKDVCFLADAAQFYSFSVHVDWRAAGAHLRRDVPRFREIFEALPPDARNSLAARIRDLTEVQVPGYETVLPASMFRIQQDVNPNYGVAVENGLVVALDLEVSAALQREGMVRDMVRHLQVLRKDAGLSVNQRVELGLASDSAALCEAIAEHRRYIMDELLAVRLEEAPLDEFHTSIDIDIDKHKVMATMTW